MLLQVRLNLLPPLLEEAYAHLHACLCASSLGRKLFVLPFHRDVRVTPAVIVIMHSALAHCKEVGVRVDGGVMTLSTRWQHSS